LSQSGQRRAEIRRELGDFSLLRNSAIGTDLPQDLETLLRRDDEEPKLIELINHRRDLVSLRQRASQVSLSTELDNETNASSKEEAAHAALDMWQSAAGNALETLIGELRAIFPDLPSVAATDPDTAFQTALSRVNAELVACNSEIGITFGYSEALKAW
jgi:hypothetical protein